MGASAFFAHRVGWFSATDPTVRGDSTAGVPSPTESLIPHQKATIDVAGPAEIRDDPSEDGWQSEAFHREAQKALKELGKLIGSSAKIDPDACRLLVTSQFHCGPLVPEHLVTVYEDGAVRVERDERPGPSTLAAPLDPQPDESNERDGYRGADGLAAALGQLSAPLRGAGDVRVKFKIIQVDLTPDSATTKQYLSVFGSTAAGLLEQHATWVTTWKRHSAAAAPLLASIRVEEFQQVRTPGNQGRLFADCTDSVLGGNACYESQILRGYNYWLQRTRKQEGIFLLGTPGIAIGDVNQDGREDLYVCQEDGLPNLLLIAQPDGTVQNVADRWGVDWLHNSRSALFVDWDNDGDQDLAVSVSGGVILASNEEGKEFSFRDLLPSDDDDTMSLSAADYDNDGALDLYVCVYMRNVQLGQSSTGIQATDGITLFHDANDSAPNYLYRNEGHWRFRDVTSDVGLDQSNHRFSFASAWEDFDNDGDQDLYVANDFGRNNLYRNDVVEGGRRQFVDVAASAGVEDSASGMSVTWGDYDLDGWIDLYISNMFSAAGNRIAFQRHFKESAPADVRTTIQRFARGNTLFKNLGNGTFRDVSVAASVTMGRWGWGSNFVDVNNDGAADLLVANGYITGDDTRDL